MSDVLRLLHWVFGPHGPSAPPGIVVPPSVTKPVTPVKAPVGHHRDYGDTKFPIEISAWKVAWVPSVVQNYGLWDALPAALKAKITKAVDQNEDLSITMAELDTIDDDTWGKIKVAANF